MAVLLTAGLALGGYIALAPSPAGICDRLFELAGGEERALAEVTREDCEDSYRAREAGRGRLEFASLGWCIRFADTLEGAGRC
jgi:hypothetical protein